ncbi:MAG: STAS domain-containing protein [Planctomycetota bacterium]
MKSSITIEYGENALMTLKITGKLIGHTARRSLEMLKSAVEQGQRSIILDLSGCTSIDSLGMTILEWIASKNGSLDVNVCKSPAIELESLAAVNLNVA